MPANETTATLQGAVDGLLYQSETDAPWKAFAWPKAQGTPTPEEVRRQGRHKPDAPVEERAVDEFLTPLGEEQDWYGDPEKADAAKYRGLLEIVKQRLKNAKVVKIGARKRAVYILGEAAEGGWAGLKTTAVET